jgi:hypothetical protein
MAGRTLIRVGYQVALFALLVVAGMGGSLCRADSLSADFSAAANPNGHWAYGYKDATAPVSTFTLDPANFAGYAGSVGGWYLPNPPYNIPGVNKNFDSINAVSDGSTIWRPNEVISHPGEDLAHGIHWDSVIQWTAPTTGAYLLQVALRGASIAGTSTLFTMFSGLAPIGPAVLTTGYQPAPHTVFVGPVLLTAGQKLSFVVNDAGNQNNDSTGISINITPLSDGTAAPLPGVALAGSGLFSLVGLWRKRRNASAAM